MVNRMHVARIRAKARETNSAHRAAAASLKKAGEAMSAGDDKAAMSAIADAAAHHERASRSAGEAAKAAKDAGAKKTYALMSNIAEESRRIAAELRRGTPGIRESDDATSMLLAFSLDEPMCET